MARGACCITLMDATAFAPTKTRRISAKKTVYENGTGKFYLNSVGELMWQDNVDGAGDNTVFVNCGD